VTLTMKHDVSQTQIDRRSLRGGAVEKSISDRA
jgi:hypothetical protein